MPHNNPELRQLNINIIGYGKVQLDTRWQCDNARNYFTRLYLVIGGSGYLRSETENIEMTPGNIYLIPSEYDFSYGCESLEKIFFHILLPAADKTDILSKIGKILTLTDQQEIIRTLTDLHDARDTASLIKTKMLIYAILDGFISQYHPHLADDRFFSPLVQQAIDYIWQNISVKLSVKDIAPPLFISESKLRNIFRAEVGTPIGTYIDNAVFFTVRKLLTEGYSIEQIASSLDFCDRNYLSRRFKEKFGKTISQYRQELFI